MMAEEKKRTVLPAIGGGKKREKTPVAVLGEAAAKQFYPNTNFSSDGKTPLDLARQRVESSEAAKAMNTVVNELADPKTTEQRKKELRAWMQDLESRGATVEKLGHVLARSTGM